MTRESLDELRSLAAGCPATRFRANGLFVAYCGVLTIVFEGFDDCILTMKDEIDRAFPDLEEEHEGSMWPKVTLAVLRDSERLTEAEVSRLRDVAEEWHGVICSDADPVTADELLAVEYGCRSLEVRQRVEHLPLQSRAGESPLPPHHARFVRSVVGQFSRDRLREYHAAIDREGHRETHYREPATGWSLVADVAAEQMPVAHDVLEAVEKAVPGKYARLRPESWHITVRSLDRAT